MAGGKGDTVYIELRAELSRFAKDLAAAGTMAAAAGAKIGHALSRAVGTATANMTRSLSQAFTQLGSAVNRVASSLQGFGKTLAGVGVAVGGGLAIPAKQFATFDDAFLRLTALAGLAGNDLQRVRDTVLELGRTTSFTAREVTDMAIGLATAGANTADALMAMLPVALEFTRATNISSDEAGRHLQTMLNVFKLSLSEARHYGDMFVQTMTNTATTADELREAMTNAAPAARALGLSYQDVFRALVALSQAGRTGAEAATMLSRAMDLMVDPQANKRLMEAMGKTFHELVAEHKDIVRVMQVVWRQFLADAGGDMMRAAGKLGEVFGEVRAERFVKAVAEANVAEIDAMLGAAEGRLAGFSARIDSGIGGAMRRLWSAVEGISLAIGEELAAAFSDSIDKLSAILPRLTAWIREHRDVIIIAAKAAIAVAGLGTALFAAGTAMKLISPVLTVVGVLLGGLVSVIGSVVGGVMSFLGALAALGPIGLALAATIGTVGAAFAYSFGRGVYSAVKAGTELDNLFSRINNTAGNTWRELTATVSAGWDRVVAAFETGELSHTFRVVWTEFKLAATIAIRGVIGILDELSRSLIAAIHNIATSIVKDMLNALAQLAKVSDALSLPQRLPIIGAKKAYELATGKKVPMPTSMTEAVELLQAVIPLQPLPGTAFTGVLGDFEKQLDATIEQLKEEQVINDAITAELKANMQERVAAGMAEFADKVAIMTSAAKEFVAGLDFGNVPEDAVKRLREFDAALAALSTEAAQRGAKAELATLEPIQAIVREAIAAATAVKVEAGREPIGVGEVLGGFSAWGWSMVGSTQVRVLNSIEQNTRDTADAVKELSDKASDSAVLAFTA